MNRQFKTWLGVVTMAVVLAGCGSSVKLDEVPVEDKAGAASGAGMSSGQGTGAGAGAGQNTVAGVNLGGADVGKAGPQIAKVIYFDYDSASIKPEFQAVIDAHARYLKANKDSKVMIEGHTDERGGREYNLALGQKRSEAVRRALALLGVSDAQLEAVSFGKEKPVASGADEAGWAKNRRAEIAYR